jgi:hypothetical protein
MANFNVSTTVTNLGETDIVVPTTDNYIIQCTLQLPNVVPSATAGAGGGAGTGTGGGPQLNSQVVTVVKQNSTTRYTSNAGDRGFITQISCTAGDTIKVITSSSLSQDQQPQAVQVTITVTEGVL